ncbi:hypothetical protein CesoFtcFv8_004563 [Champsocephalus esox]|uniref:Uncharacterized protein n=1 Tax=Champsocephalus esox TaxID=159716 RepID=A0AAN8CNE6_9TELE|nr:hypothetical protein CesoFtcFv8_004563 [Champsocephalus esox]
MLGFEQKMADLEDRNRRCNIRVYGLHEDAEGDAPVQFLECMIPTWFPALKQLKPEIERAHRIFCGGPPYGGRTTPGFYLLLSTRQAILREWRGNTPLQSATELSTSLLTSGIIQLNAEEHSHGLWLWHGKRELMLS